MSNILRGARPTHEIQVILDKIACERRQWQAPVRKGQHKGVVGKTLPDAGNIRPVEEVFNKSTAGPVSEEPWKREPGHLRRKR